MNKKVLGLVIVIFAGMLLLGFTAPSFADMPPDINSRWATITPIINGTIAPGEWADAALVNFTLQMRTRSTGSLVKTLSGSLMVKNDWDNLYVAIQIFNGTYLDHDAGSHYSQLCILFSNNDSATLYLGDQGEGFSVWSGSPFFHNNDMYYTGGVGGYWDSVVDAGQTNDGNLSWTHTNPIYLNNGTWTMETRIPLVDVNPGYGFNIPHASLPWTVGFKVWYAEQNIMDGVYPDYAGTPISLDQTTNASTYGDLTIYPPYYLTVVTTAGGNTNPAPGLYGPYSYGDVVPVQALPSPGYTFDHWTLDAVNVGSTNPYSVTMNQNHTIEAFFTLIPTPSPVGGISFYSVAPPASATTIAYGAIFGLATVGIVVSRRRKK